MRILPRSLFGRLLAIAVVSTLAALAFAGFAIGHVLERFVMAGMDQRLDAQVLVLARAVQPDGRIDPARMIDLPPFGEPGSGWVWRIDGPRGAVRTSGADVPDIPPDDAWRPPHPRRGRERGPPMDAGDLRTGGHRGLHYRRLAVATAAGPVVVTAGGPRGVVERPLRAAMLPLFASLAALGVALAVATLVQLRLGLRPLRTLATALAAVRAGRASRVPDEQPQELAPVVAELNALIAQNIAGLEHARRHVANLAHGLKTPLAALAVRLAEPGRDPDGTLGAMVGRIDRQVRHHLGRARASAPGSAIRVRTMLAGPVSDLVGVLRRVHAERTLDVAIDVADVIAVAVDAQDADEMLGNLLDNAWRHARTALRIAARREGALVRITIEDDGPGLSPDAAVEAMVPGRRLDERGDGHGFGLSITRELADLNGGSLTLEPVGRQGGLRAVLMLPAPIDDAP